PTTATYTLSLHDALPICQKQTPQAATRHAAFEVAVVKFATQQISELPGNVFQLFASHDDAFFDRFWDFRKTLGIKFKLPVQDHEIHQLHELFEAEGTLLLQILMCLLVELI